MRALGEGESEAREVTCSTETATAPSAEATARRREAMLLLILASVQFTSIVDFMVVMPLGPQLMRTLGITPAQFGLIVSSYTISAGLAGLLASSFMDRFGRKAGARSVRHVARQSTRRPWIHPDHARAGGNAIRSGHRPARPVRGKGRHDARYPHGERARPTRDLASDLWSAAGRFPESSMQ